MTNTVKIKKITLTAMFCALAFVCTLYVKIPGIAGFLTLDVKDSLIVLSSLLLGPLSGAVVAVAVPFLELVTISSTGVIGFIMNALSSLTFALVTGLIYKMKKNMTGAVIGLLAGVVSVTAVMLVLNLLLTPIYTGMPTSTVAGMIPKILLPFNLVKASMNAALVLLLYKPLSKILRKTGMIPKRTAPAEGQPSEHSRLRSVLVTVIALGVIAAAMCVVIFVLGIPTS